MLSIRTPDCKLASRPIAPATTEGLIFSHYLNTKSGKVDDVNRDPHVNINFYDPKPTDWVSISGDAKINKDPAKIKHWSDKLKSWFDSRGSPYTGSHDDPRVAMLDTCPPKFDTRRLTAKSKPLLTWTRRPSLLRSPHLARSSSSTRTTGVGYRRSTAPQGYALIAFNTIIMLVRWADQACRRCRWYLKLQHETGMTFMLLPIVIIFPSPYAIRKNETPNQRRMQLQNFCSTLDLERVRLSSAKSSHIISPSFPCLIYPRV
ncbi:hypothetical protein K437DRAFT_23703 [Tilletiaria anomala UBC 951]|uniref:General stress protein FMN-binding split barrel domain-containing protein n=1 Tax=Tilletiaria anomala (strain ATCC 24038 / CBS 436.72 / UBC 951) TaxID=1037660 RepID=A0A066VAB9_TILAU|nr:uncharacterized protein K437DRAFT_23703 [Tilletiaria anomala UBC 951]KDN38386.1 hypothetical protein K437DRAFT_23703 [Tilletiaria anomala UBC 951]